MEIAEYSRKSKDESKQVGLFLEVDECNYVVCERFLDNGLRTGQITYPGNLESAAKAIVTKLVKLKIEESASLSELVNAHKALIDAVHTWISDEAEPKKLKMLKVKQEIRENNKVDLSIVEKGKKERQSAYKPEDLISVKDAADATKVDLHKIYKFIQGEEIVATKYGKFWMINEDQFEKIKELDKRPEKKRGRPRKDSAKSSVSVPPLGSKQVKCLKPSAKPLKVNAPVELKGFVGKTTGLRARLRIIKRV